MSFHRARNIDKQQLNPESARRTDAFRVSHTHDVRQFHINIVTQYIFEWLSANNGALLTFRIMNEQEVYSVLLQSMGSAAFHSATQWRLFSFCLKKKQCAESRTPFNGV